MIHLLNALIKKTEFGIIWKYHLMLQLSDFFQNF